MLISIFMILIQPSEDIVMPLYDMSDAGEVRELYHDDGEFQIFDGLAYEQIGLCIDLAADRFDAFGSVSSYFIGVHEHGNGIDIMAISRPYFSVNSGAEIYERGMWSFRCRYFFNEGNYWFDEEEIELLSRD